MAPARGLLQVAGAAGKPDTFWQTGSRVTLARDVLGVPGDGPPRARMRETDERSGSA